MYRAFVPLHLANVFQYQLFLDPLTKVNGFEASKSYVIVLVDPVGPELKLTELPAQIVFELTDAEIAGTGFIVTFIELEAVHPAAFVPVTVYEVGLTGETEMAAVFCPVFQE
jgi:hypothetical protein